MNKPGDGSNAVERSQWLAELGEAVDQAQRLARKMGVSEGDCASAKELFERLETVRIEIEALRRGSWDRRSIETDPSWTNLFPWNRRTRF